ncbi:hypothetical protein [Mesorhizobium marinum]|uniref:Co-chaperone DjlA N-terminal domain-containing protein n=1 Tax=Mesorhizobium marinum TaxID=3228790 RepID=A0ABV3QW06_9HYPH
MHGQNAAARIADIEASERITPLDVLELRRLVFRDGVVTGSEAQALFRLNDACPDQCAEWPVFFVEAITDHIVHQARPAGYISAQNADWLIGAVSRSGVVETRTELELLVRVLEVAKFSTERLAAFALAQVKEAVVEGKGALMQGGELVPGVIEKAEVDLLRRILYAFGGDGNIAITRAEAEVLFEINDAVASARNDPSWNDLFVKAIANFVMCASGYQAPTREVALRQESFLDRADANIGGFLARMASTGGRELLAAYRQSVDIDADWEARNQWHDACARRAERCDNVEARWLAERIGKDGRLQENELALVRFIKETSPSIHPELQPLLEKVA